MATPLAADTRRPRAVVRLLLRGLLSMITSLTVGRVLAGAALVWMAAVFISAETPAEPPAPNAVVQLAARSEEDFVADEFSFVDGEHKLAPVNNNSVGLDSQIASIATATPARSLAELRARYAPAAIEPVAAGWPFVRGHDDGGGLVATDGGQPAVAIQSVAAATDARESALEFFAEMMDKRSPTSGRPAPEPAGPVVRTPTDELMGGAVDLVSRIVCAVAGQQAGTDARATLTKVADQVSAALAAGNTLDKHGADGKGSSGFQLAMPERTSHDGGPGLAPERNRRPIGCLAIGCADRDPSRIGHHPGVGGGRGPPATHRPRPQHDNPNENDPASRSSEYRSQAAGQIDEFVSDLLEAIGGSKPGSSAGQPPRRPATLDDLEQLLGGVTDLVVGLVTAIAGKQAGAQVREALTAAGQDVLRSLAAGGRYRNGSGAGQSTGGDGNWSLNNDGRFPTAECDGDVECALAAGDPQRREPNAPANRGPPRLLDDDPTQQALNDRLAAIQGQKNLDAAKTQLDAGKLTQAAYDEQSAAYQHQRDTVTAQLRLAAGYGRTNYADPGTDGAGAVCTTTGAFAECSTAVIDPATGRVERDQSFCLIGVSGCTATSTAGDRTATASCDPTKGCTTNSTAGVRTATTTCGTGQCVTATTAETTGADTYCQARNGCIQKGRTPTRLDAQGKNTGSTEDYAQTEGTCTKDCALTGHATFDQVHADCTTREGTCDTTSSGREINRPADQPGRENSGVASAWGICKVTTVGCSATTTVTLGTGTPDVAQAPPAEAVVRCAEGATGCDGTAISNSGGALAHTEVDAKAHSGHANCRINVSGCTAVAGGTEAAQTYTTIDCAGIESCDGYGFTSTYAWVTADANDAIAKRETDARNTCTTNGSCGLNATSAANKEIGAQLGTNLTAHSKTTAELHCTFAACTSTSAGRTSGRASGDITGIRDSEAITRCKARGDGADCGTVTATDVTERAGTGPASASHGDAQNRCTDATDCAGESYTEASALDTAISPYRRGAATTGGCDVRNGNCRGRTSADASSTNDYLTIDPVTGKPVTGPTATAATAASVDCRTTTCGGNAYTSSAAWDGAVGDGRVGSESQPRTSSGTVGCEPGATWCQVQIMSAALSGPGATRAFAGDDANPARLGAGPSAASVIGGKRVCSGECGGGIHGAVLATNPGVAPGPRGNLTEASCTGGNCTAVINGAASSSPDANSIKPMVTDLPSVSARVTSIDTPGDPVEAPGQNQRSPATAPGSSSSAGGAGVAGASSWTTAWAALNCATGAGPCKGGANSSATGINGPEQHTGGTGARGPPASSTATSSSTCDSPTTCQAVSSSVAGTGQVVADVRTERNNQTSGHEPVDPKRVPATWSESEAIAECADPRCTATVTGTANAEAAQDGNHSKSSGEGSAGCTGSGSCRAAITTSATASPRERSAATSASIAATCVDGTEVGCPTKVSSRTESVDADGRRATSTASCDTTRACLAATDGTASPDGVRAAYQCAGDGCTGRAEGSDGASHECTATEGGQCSGSVQVVGPGGGGQSDASGSGYGSGGYGTGRSAGGGGGSTGMTSSAEGDGSPAGNRHEIDAAHSGAGDRPGPRSRSTGGPGQHVAPGGRPATEGTTADDGAGTAATGAARGAGVSADGGYVTFGRPGAPGPGPRGRDLPPAQTAGSSGSGGPTGHGGVRAADGRPRDDLAAPAHTTGRENTSGHVPAPDNASNHNQYGVPPPDIGGAS